MQIDDIVDVQISAQSAFPTRQGFSTAMLMAYHTENTDLFREYSSLSGLVADGHDSDSAAYKMALSALAQNPRLRKFKLGRITTAVAPTFELTVTTHETDAVIACTVNDSDGNATTASYTVQSGDTTDTLAAVGFEVQVEAVTGITSSPSAAVVTATGTSGKMYWFSDLQNCTIKDITPDASIDDDLDAIQLIDDDWYGVAIQYASKLNTDVVAAWTEDQKKIFVCQTQDDEELTSGGVQGHELQSQGYDRTAIIFNGDTEDYIACGALGKMLPQDPGSNTWCFKKIAGSSPDALDDTEIGYLAGDNMNYYVSIAGLPMLLKGTMASGQFIDVTIFIDWLSARMKERIFTVLANQPKLPYTNAGLAVLGAEMRAVLKIGEQVGGLDPGSTSVFVPLVEDIDPSDRAERLVTGLTFSGRLAGAVHKAVIQGTVTV